MPNATMTKFGHPLTVVAETPCWTVQVRPQQPTLGSLVLVAKEPVQAFGALSPDAFADLQPTVARIERMLTSFVGYSRINYLMLMMVDPDVHFHVIPRYEGTRTYGGIDFADAGWPGPPSLKEAVALPEDVRDRLTADLRAAWAAGAD